MLKCTDENIYQIYLSNLLILEKMLLSNLSLAKSFIT